MLSRGAGHCNLWDSTYVRRTVRSSFRTFVSLSIHVVQLDPRFVRLLPVHQVPDRLLQHGGRQLLLQRIQAQAGMNCIIMGLPGKLILSKRNGLREVIFS